jgi:chemotaxis protein methyltransferase CheR
MPNDFELAEAPPLARLSPDAFSKIRDLTYRYAGIKLRNGKEPLVETRLARLVREYSLHSFDEYCNHVAADSTGLSLARMIDALTTNHTSFLREPAHFEFLRSLILPQTQGRPRVWSAACASGEEPYTIACSILGELKQARPTPGLRLMATDISNRCLATARLGRYPAARVNCLPPSWIASFFEPGSGEWHGWYQVRAEIRAAIDFRRHNLMDQPPPGSRFDLIFCRNAMIYMDRATQERAIKFLTGSLEPGGYLFIGHAESLSAIPHDLTYVQPSIYRKPALSGTPRKEKS